jgi:hypothetical protein
MELGQDRRNAEQRRAQVDPDQPEQQEKQRWPAGRRI